MVFVGVNVKDNGDLYDFDTSCPNCGNKTVKKTLGLCQFTACTDFFNCKYFNIDNINSIIENPDETRMELEKEWYIQRINMFRLRQRKKIKQEFIAKEMEKLKVKE